METEMVGAIKDLANAIAHNNGMPWQTIVAIVVMAFVGIIGAAGGAYWRRRGENLATKADFIDLQDQLKANTRATEEIKAKISFDDWRAREANALRRAKLEEAHELFHSISTDAHLWALTILANDELTDQNIELFVSAKRKRLETVVNLYLPAVSEMFLEFLASNDRLIRNEPVIDQGMGETDDELRLRITTSKNAYVLAAAQFELRLIEYMQQLIDGTEGEVANAQNPD